MPVQQRVAFATAPLHVEHAVPGHPEGPARLEAILTLLRECGLLQRLQQIEPRAATDDELAFVHDPHYLQALDRACEQGGGWADMDTYLTSRSCAAARQAAGACIEATRAVLSGDARSAFCAVRPPGHHARPAQAMGFCLLNNVASAARYAQRTFAFDRIAIIDIDVHHGNGTQEAFYDDRRVLYVSTHEYPYYPGTGRLEETGAGDAEGTNVNIPLPAGAGDAEYAAAFEQVVERVVRRYRPQLILVSCGFDAHYADPLAGMALSVAGYGDLMERSTSLAAELCDGRVVVVLEGGYDLTAVAWGARTVIEVLLGDTPTPDPPGPPPASGRTPNVEQLLAQVQRTHRLA